MSKNGKTIVYLLGAYALLTAIIGFAAIAQGEGAQGFGLAAIVISGFMSVLLFAIGIILGLINLFRDNGPPGRALDQHTEAPPLLEGYLSPLAFFASAGLILLIGGSLCFGSIAMT